MDEFERELMALINRHSLENRSDTPDFILAWYIRACLDAFNRCVRERVAWYGGRKREAEQEEAP